MWWVIMGWWVLVLASCIVAAWTIRLDHVAHENGKDLDKEMDRK
jgi:hypothetical protein